MECWEGFEFDVKPIRTMTSPGQVGRAVLCAPWLPTDAFSFYPTARTECRALPPISSPLRLSFRTRASVARATPVWPPD